MLLEEMDRSYKDGERSICAFLIFEAYNALDVVSKTDVEQLTPTTSIRDLLSWGVQPGASWRLK